MAIQYMVLGFEPTTFETWVYSHNHYTRAPVLKSSILFETKYATKPWLYNVLCHWMIHFKTNENKKRKPDLSLLE